MKKFLSIVLTLFLIVSIVPSGAFTFTASALTSDGYYDSGNCGTNVTWSYDESTQTLIISGTGYMEDLSIYDDEPSYFHLSQRIKHVVINEGVTKIGSYAFKHLIFLQDIEIPKNLKYIGSDAFGSTYLKSIYNYSSLTFTIGSAAYGGIAKYATFIGNYYKASGTCGTNATWSLDSRYRILYINGSGAMSNGCYSKWTKYNSDIIEIVINKGITSIGNESFKGCTNVSTITIPNTVNSIGNDAFSNMTWLSKIAIPDGVTSIGERAFYGCTNLNSVEFPNKLTIIQEGTFNGCTKLTSINIPSSVREIHNNAFYGCSNLSDVELSDVSKIFTNAFYNCVKITEIDIPKSLFYIGTDAFLGCTGIERVNIESIKDWYEITFDNKHSNPLYYSKELWLNGNKVTSLVIPEEISSVKAYSFIRCADLANIEFHSGVTNVGEYAFAECPNVLELTLPKELTDIGENAFDTSVTIFGYKNSASEEYATQNGNTFYSSSDNTVNELISWSYDKGTLYINGMNSIPNYNLFTSTPWYEIKDYIKSVEIDERITSVGTYSFYGCDNLAAIATDNKNLIFGQYSVNTNNTLTFYGYSGGSLEEYCLNNDFNFVKHLKRPNITEITPDTITVEKNTEWLYSLDKINWTSNNVFKNLNECTQYTVYVRRAEGLTPMAMRSSEGAAVTTLPYPTPDMPVLSKMTADTIEVVKVDGLEYSLDKENWNSTGKFTGLKCLTSYRVYARPVTNIVAAQKVSEPLAVTTPDYPIPEAPTLNTVTDTTISVNTKSGFEYSLDKINWTTTGKFTGLSPAQSYSVYVRPVTTIPEAQKVSEALVITTLKSTVPAPSAPVIESYNNSRVVIEAVEGYEYSKDGINWQNSNVFIGIPYDTLYYFYQRVAETDTEYVSPSSMFTKLIIPNVPTINFVGATTLSVNVKDGYEYSLDKVYWQTSGEFDKLITGLEYTVYCRPEYQTALHQVISGGVTVTINGKDRAEAPSAPTLSSKTDTTVTLTKVMGYEYSKDGVTWQNSNVFENLMPLTQYSFYQRIAENATNAASKQSGALVVTTDKPVANKPYAPTLSSKTDTMVTLTKVAGYEYSKDGITWQASNVFTGLSPATKYNFYQRVAETSTAYASASSNAFSVTTEKSTPTKPSAPTLSSKTDTSVTLTKITGYEYKMDSGSWQTSNVFSGLLPYSTHTFYQRVATTSTSNASASSNALTVITNKSSVAKPLAPTVISKTDTTVTLTKVAGYEYSKDGIAWQASNVFIGLSPATKYNFYQRVAETSTAYASAPSDALSVTTEKSTPTKPSAPTLSSKTDTSVTLTKVTGYEYKMDSGSWQTSNVFSGLLPYSTHTFYQRVATTSTSNASASSNALTVITNKSSVAKPLAPTVISKTDTTVTLTKVAGYEYSKDGITWQASNVFTGLSPATKYNFYQRVAETSTVYASASSNAFSVTTEKSTPEKPSAPTLLSKTDTKVTLTKITGYEYSKDGITWQSSNVFDGLSPDTAYTFYQRVAETDTFYVSVKSESLNVTTLKVCQVNPKLHVYIDCLDDTCNHCGAIRVAPGHTGGIANCKDKAVCSVCKKAYGEVNKNNHKNITTLPAKAPTCTQTGLTVGAKCTACGLVTQAQVTTMANGHDWSEYYFDWNSTCTEDGTKTRWCYDCDEEETIADIGSAHGHWWSEYCSDGNATCTEDGTKTRWCYDCDEEETITDIGSAHGHDWGEYCSDGNATCTEDGTKTRWCYDCDKKETITNKGSAYGHYLTNYISKVKVATLSADGTVFKKCTNCNGMIKASTISKIKSIKLSKSTYTYTGKALKPSVTVKDSKGKTISKSYYSVKYSNNKKVGKATVKVTFKGRYSGSKTLYFKINPKKTSISSLKAGKKAFTVKYKKQTSGSGYEIQYSTSKKFKSAKTVKIKSNKTVSKTVKKLKAKKTYYVRIRVVKGSYKSAWSTVKKVKTKK